MQRGRLFIILGVVLGLAVLGALIFLVVGGGIVNTLFTSEPTPIPTAPGQEREIPTQEVIVALQPIPRGAQFVEGSIGRRPWPAESVPPDVIQDEIETIGMVAKTEIVQGQIIVRGMLAPMAGSDNASFRVPPGKVAVAYPMDRQSSVAFAIQPDDFVDILISASFLDVDEEFQTILPNKIQFFFPVYDPETGEAIGFEISNITDEGRFEVAGDFSAIVYGRHVPPTPRQASQLTVEAAKVLKIGLWIEEPAPPTPEAAGEEEVPTPTPSLPDIVTLAVTPQDALVLLWLRQSGVHTEMALRSANEENADHLTEAVTLQYMLTRFNIAVPPKIEFIMASEEDIRDLELAEMGLFKLRPDEIGSNSIQAGGGGE